ncbi:nucleoside phosphorylase [Legionella septentrionalis]|uniref:nucleoside phosphorylase n=1 Tax=Legionella septentrionalis TaxID=2498109 RepID=UPI000F8E0A5B|nr:nucleoside phosphorylase [Legionella septentrionalis]RUR15216.1 phosphorylase [Legionella septentrionalis]
MIKAAELPLNKRGAVYHLDLLPEEIGDLIITVGDPARVEEISRHFDRVEVKRAHREFVTHTGTIGPQRLSVISTGIGIPNIDIVMNELDALVNVDLTNRMPCAEAKSLIIIRLGTTGGLQETCKPGDVILSRFAIGFDTLLNYYQGELSEHSKIEKALKLHMEGESGPFYLVEADTSLLHHFKNMGSVGITATCGGFYGPQGRRLRIPLFYPAFLDKLAAFAYSNYQVLNFEMETAGILGLGRLLGHHCLSISVIIANRVTGVFASDIKATVEEFIEKALSHFEGLSRNEVLGVRQEVL